MSAKDYLDKIIEMKLKEQCKRALAKENSAEK
jgi:hypothetical protein